jgi:BioD-like phosphotransacetylase family protein|tara:strand:- start:196 stop:702 length:507 start_codon:yes stop_codon:yes gene_type:complete
MSKASDALAKLIDDQIKKQREKMDLKVDKAIALYKSGNEKADEVVEKVETDIETAKDAKEKVSDAIDRIKSVRLSFDSGRKAAETTEKASTIGSALNPAAAAIAYAQKFIIDKLKIEIKDIGDELNVAPQILDNLEKFFVRTRKKIRKEKARREAQKRIAAENKKMLS